MKSTKGIFSIIGLSLLLLISIISIASFQNWFTVYSSQTFTNLETESSGGELTPIRIPQIIGDKIYLENTQGLPVQVEEIKINGDSCGGSGTYGSGIIELDTNCRYALDSSGEVEVVIVTNEDVIEQNYYLPEDDVTPACINNTAQGFEGGTGTEGDPWQVCNCSMFQSIGNYANRYYELTNDIDCSISRTWNYNGSAYEGFRGGSFSNSSLDGKGYSINNLYVNRPQDDDVGLFSISYSFDPHKVMKNIAFLNVDITGGDRVGGVFSSSGSLLNTYITGTIRGDSEVGAFKSNTAGLFSNGQNHVVNSYSDVELISRDGSAGGLVSRVSYSANINHSFSILKSNDLTNSGSLFHTDATGILCDNLFWLNTSENSNNYIISGTGCDSDVTVVQDFTYFYGNDNEPMASWNTSIWSFDDNRLPQLIKQN